MLGITNVTVLPNGCRIATSAMPGVESLSMCIDAGTGGRCERASELGFSHFLFQLVFCRNGQIILGGSRGGAVRLDIHGDLSVS